MTIQLLQDESLKVYKKLESWNDHPIMVGYIYIFESLKIYI